MNLNFVTLIRKNKICNVNYLLKMQLCIIIDFANLQNKYMLYYCVDSGIHGKITGSLGKQARNKRKDARKEVRERISLNGLWRFKILSPGAEGGCYDPATDDSLWEQMPVPDFWNGGGWFHAFGDHIRRHGYHAGFAPARYPDYHGVAVYRRWVNDSAVSQNGPAPRVVLHFEAVAAGCTLYVNGRDVLRHLGPFDPFECDVTDAWKPGEPNLLALRVEDLRMFQHGSDTYRASYYLIGNGEFCNGAGGIWQSVWLEKRPANGFRSVQIDTRQRDLHLQLELYDADFPRTFRLTLLDGERVVHEHSFRQTALRREIPEAEPWSPDSPQLYTLRLECLDEAGANVDRVERWIGFRHLEIVGKEFRLNGRPFFLRGASFPPATMIPEDKAYIERYLRMLKEHNIQVLHGSKEPLPTPWLEACDRIGLCVIQMSSFTWKTPPLDQARAELASLVRNSLGHPCVILYCLGHESSYPTQWDKSPHTQHLPPREYFEQLAQVVRGFGVELPILHDMAFCASRCGGEIDTWTNFFGWYYHTAYNFSRCLEKLSPQEHVYPDAPLEDRTFSDRLKRGAEISGERPLIFSEPIGAYSHPEDGHLLQTAFRMRRVGRKPALEADRPRWLEANLEYAADLAERATHAMRRLRLEYPHVAGQLSFMAGNWLFHPLDAARMTPKPILKALGRANSPVLPSLESWQEHFYAGRTHSLTLQVIHDEFLLPVLHGEVIVHLLRSDGMIVSEAEFPEGSSVTVEEGRNVRVAFRLSIPAEARTGWHRLVLRCRTSEKEYASERKVFVASEEWVRRPLDDCGEFELYDPAGETRNTLLALNVPCRTLDANGFVQPSNLPLVIGAGCLDSLEANPALCHALREQVFGGRRVLVLEQKAPVRGTAGIGRNESFRRRSTFLPDRTLTLTREFTWGCTNRNSFEYDDVVHPARQEHPIFDGLDALLLRRWGQDTILISSYLQSAELVFPPGYREDGYVNDYRTRCPPNITPLAECFLYCRDMAAAEIRHGKGLFLWSQLEAHRHWRDDPVAARYLLNLIRAISQPS